MNDKIIRIADSFLADVIDQGQAAADPLTVAVAIIVVVVGFAFCVVRW